MRYDAIRRRVTKLCNDHQLARVEILIFPGSGRDGYRALAHPEVYHPRVEKRRKKELAALADTDGSVRLDQIAEISDKLFGPVARATGSTIEGVLKALQEALEKQEPG